MFPVFWALPGIPASFIYLYGNIHIYAWYCYFSVRQVIENKLHRKEKQEYSIEITILFKKNVYTCSIYKNKKRLFNEFSQSLEDGTEDNLETWKSNCIYGTGLDLFMSVPMSIISTINESLVSFSKLKSEF